MPNSAVGLTTAFGCAEESTYGTPVAPDRWFEILSESLERQQTITTSSGLRSGTRNLRRGSRRALTQHWASGTVEMEVPTLGFGRILKHALGGTPTIAQQGATTAYLQTHTMGSLAGKMLTLQKQMRDESNGLVQQLTYSGSKITSFGMSCGVGEILTASIDFDSRDVDKTTAAGSPSYPTTNAVYHYAQGTVYVAGSSVAKVTQCDFTLDNNLKTDSYFLGTSGLKGEPFANDFPELTGSISIEFDSIATAYDRFAADTEFEIRLEFVSTALAGAGFPYALKVTIPGGHFTGGTPTVGGPDVVVPDVPFEAAYDGTNPGLTITYMSIDTAV